MKIQLIKKPIIKIKISQDLAREAFEFGRKLGLLEDVEFNDFFSDKVLKRVEENVWKERQEFIALQMSRVDKLQFYLLNDTNVKDITRFIKHTDKELVEQEERNLGFVIIDHAFKKGLGFEMYPPPGRSDEEFFKCLIKIVPNKAIKGFSETYHDDKKYTEVVADTIKGPIKVKVKYYSGMSFYTQVLTVLNQKLRGDLDGKMFVRYKTQFSEMGFLMINQTAKELEDNPFIPFFYRDNLFVLDQDPITEEDVQKALERYSQPPKDGGKWISHFLGKVPKKFMKPSGWEASFKKFGYHQPKL